MRPFKKMVCGFTLLEVMVVLFIVGIAVTIVSTRTTGPHHQQPDAATVLVEQLNVELGKISTSLPFINRAFGLFYYHHEDGSQYLSFAQQTGPTEWQYAGKGKLIPIPPGYTLSPLEHFSSSGPAWIFSRNTFGLDDISVHIGYLSDERSSKGLLIAYDGVQFRAISR